MGRGLAIGRLDRGQSADRRSRRGGLWRLAYAVPATMAAMALVAGLRAPAGDTLAVDGGLRALAALREPSARSLTLAERASFRLDGGAHYAGAFYIDGGVGESTVGVLLAVGSPRLSRRIDQQRRLAASSPAQALIALQASGALSVPKLNSRCRLVHGRAVLRDGLLRGRGPPARAPRPRAATSAPRQHDGCTHRRCATGYAIGAKAGGAVLALSDFGALGFAFGGMLCSALLVLRVTDPLAHGRPGYSEPVPE